MTLYDMWLENGVDLEKEAEKENYQDEGRTRRVRGQGNQMNEHSLY